MSFAGPALSDNIPCENAKLKEGVCACVCVSGQMMEVSRGDFILMQVPGLKRRVITALLL